MDSDLYGLARTCRTFFKLTEPLLYSKFVQRNSRQLSFFLRTILLKPEYAARVKLVHLMQIGDVDHGSKEGNDKDGIDPDREELATLYQACEACGLLQIRLPSPEGVNNSRQWKAAVKARKFRALFAILILSLPSLETLYIWTSGIRDQKWFGEVFDIARQSPQLLCNLKEINFKNDTQRNHIAIQDMSSCFYLPSLQKATFSKVLAEDAWRPDQHAWSNIETLHFPLSTITNAAWPILLRPMRQLKDFSYIAGNLNYGSFIESAPAGLATGLNHVKDTLETLTLGEFSLVESNEVDRLGSLRDFSKLKNVEIQIGLLLGTEVFRLEENLWELLPGSLEQVVFIGGEFSFVDFTEARKKETLDQVEEMVFRKESHFPGLRQITMRSFFRADLKPLGEVCLDRGVKFRDMLH